MSNSDALAQLDAMLAETKETDSELDVSFRPMWPPKDGYVRFRVIPDNGKIFRDVAYHQPPSEGKDNKVGRFSFDENVHKVACRLDESGAYGQAWRWKARSAFIVKVGIIDADCSSEYIQPGKCGALVLDGAKRDAFRRFLEGAEKSIRMELLTPEKECPPLTMDAAKGKVTFSASSRTNVALPEGWENTPALASILVADGTPASDEARNALRSIVRDRAADLLPLLG